MSISGLVEINKCVEMLLGGTNTELQKPISKNYPKNQGQCHTHTYYSVIKRKTAGKKQHHTEQRTPTT
jgi:hypothetical protein